ncbi:MAG TPA: hypothetical protein VKR56_12185 [Candidatus Cybelea sp.]|nr:hypothetical protein [Candidatus Cybelea sp.]
MSRPQRALRSSAMGWGGTGHGPGTNDGALAVALVKTDTLALSVAITQAIKANDNVVFI